MNSTPNGLRIYQKVQPFPLSGLFTAEFCLYYNYSARLIRFVEAIVGEWAAGAEGAGDRVLGGGHVVRRGRQVWR